MKYTILLTLSFFALAFRMDAQTNIPALILTNQVWDIGGSPYLLNQNTYIDSGISVIVKPGVEIKSNGSFRIDVNGEFQAIGTWDSLIKITKVNMIFTQKSTDYNWSNGRGTYFNYCQVEGNGSGTTCLSLNNTAIRIDHSEFFNTYYALNIVGSFPYQIIQTEITNSKFSGDIYGYGSPIYGNNMNSKLLVLNCIFSNCDNIYSYGNVVFRNNTFKKMRRINLSYLTGMNEIICNKFLNFSEGVTLDVSNYNTKVNLAFTDNTLDSFGTNINFTYHMLTLNRKASNNALKDSLLIKDNNFLGYKGKGAKVSIVASNTTPVKTDTINFQHNYWGANDSATIESFIKDYSDDINIYGRVDYSSYKNMPVTGCSFNSGCAIANFNYSVSDTTATFTDSSFSSKRYMVKWKFGDGAVNDSNLSSVTHNFHPGTYRVCMYTYDTLNNLCDSMCKSIEVYHKTTCMASYYFAYDTFDVSVIYVINTSTGTNSRTKYYWTFGDGAGSSAFKPTHTYTHNGKYQLCLTIFDTLANCYSTYCDSVEISSGEMEVVVLNEGDVLKIEKNGITNSLHVFPNPTSGEFKILLNTFQSYEIYMEVINAGGQVVKSSNYNTTAGYNEFIINLTEFESGLYCVSIRAGGEYKTVRLMIIK